MLPLYFETFGVLYLKAMYSEAVIIVIKCGGSEDFINNENGFMVEVGNVIELEAVMNTMYEQSEKFDPIKLHAFVAKLLMECGRGNA